MREYKPFLNWEEVQRSGLLDELLPECEEVEIFVPDGNKRLALLEEFPDNQQPNPLERLMLKESGEVIEDESIEDEFDNSYFAYELTQEDL